MQTDHTFGSYTGANGSHKLLGSRSGGAYAVNASGNPRSVTITGRGGTSQGIDIFLKQMNLKANHSYKFEVTGKVTTGPGPHDVFINYVSDGENASPVSLVLEKDVATNENFKLSYVTDYDKINGHLQANSAGVYRIGGASQQTFVVTGIVITAYCPAGCTCTPIIPPRTFANLSAAELVAEIGIGWNLGNAMDAHKSGQPLGYAYSDPTVPTLEVLWVNPGPSQQLIKAVKNAGFNTIRIPVTWYKVARASDLKIRDSWMSRVKEIVDWAMAEDMIVILNTHHEEPIYKGFESNSAGNMPSDSTFNDTSVKYTREFWTQIATTFKDYGEKLIFEGLNEPRDMNDDQWYGYGRGSDSTQDPRSQITYKRINQLNQTFVDAVRATGGNNKYRILMMPTYAASGFYWNTNGPLNNFRRPKDIAENEGVVNKFVLSVHRYEPKDWTLDGKTSDDKGTFTDDRLKEMVTTALGGIANRASRLETHATDPMYIQMPVILGEFAASLPHSESRRATYAEHYVKEATRLGMRAIWWDNGKSAGTSESNGLFNRSNGSILFNEIVNAMKRGRGLM
jgi:endoglucanase